MLLFGPPRVPRSVGEVEDQIAAWTFPSLVTEKPIGDPMLLMVLPELTVPPSEPRGMIW